MSASIPNNASVVSVSARETHSVEKDIRKSIRLVRGLGVEGDAHSGATVQHRSRVAANPTLTNLRQVHLIQAELFDELAMYGFMIKPAMMGENITTRGVDLLSLPTGTLLSIGATAVVEITGLRNPCAQLDEIQQGLMKANLGEGENGTLVRKAGVMAVVVETGEVQDGDSISVKVPSAPHVPLQPV